MSDPVYVAVRVRPLIPREIEAGAKPIWKVENGTVFQKDLGKNGPMYNYDYVFDQTDSTEVIYEQMMEPIIEAAMEGYNGTTTINFYMLPSQKRNTLKMKKKILDLQLSFDVLLQVNWDMTDSMGPGTVFAYGQTSSGKTHTIAGDKKNPGVIGLAVEQIFNLIENTPGREFLMRVAYMEIYSEKICDLLVGTEGLDLKEYNGDWVIKDLSENLVNSKEQIFEYLQNGNKRRHVGSTKMNDRSSRSHAIFRLIIESRERQQKEEDGDGAVVVSQINIVDLAGSERAEQTGATGVRLQEAIKINLSLTYLCQVIRDLSDRSQFIPYRNSVLTKILKNSLGGNSKTSIICNVTPVELEQTESTLRFAQSGKRITNSAHKNEVLSDEAMLIRMRKENKILKKQIEEMKTQSCVVEKEVMMQKKIDELTERHQQKISELSDLMLVSSKPQLKAKKKNRRETWAPGKARMAFGLSPGLRTSAPMDGFLKPPVFRESGASSFMFCLPATDEENSSASNSSPEEVFNRASGGKKRCSKQGAPPAESLFLEDKESQTEPQSDQAEGSEDDTKEIARLKAEVEALNRELDGSLEICERMIMEKEEREQNSTDENLELERALRQARDDKEAIETKFINLQASLEQLQGELDEKDRELTELREFTALEAELKEQSFLEKLGNGDEDLAKELQALKKTASDAEHVTMETKRLLAESQDNNKELQENLEEVKKKLSKIEAEKGDFDSYLDLEKEKNKGTQRDLRDQLQRAYDDANLLQEQLSKSGSGEVVRDLQLSQEQLTALQQQLDSLKEEKEQLESDIEETVQMNIESQDDLRTSQEETKDAKTLVKELEEKCQALQTELSATPKPDVQSEGGDSLATELLREEMELLQEKCTELEKTNGELLSELERIREEAGTQHGELRGTTDSLAAELASTEITQLKQQCQELEELNLNLLSEIERAEEKAGQSGPSEGGEDLAAEMMKAESEQLRERCTELEAENAKLVSALDEANQGVAASTNQEEVDHLRERCTQLEAENTKLLTTLDAAGQSILESTDQDRADHEEVQAELELLQQQRDELSGKLDVASEQLQEKASLVEELELLQQQRDELSGKLEQASEQLQEKASLMEEMERDMAALKLSLHDADSSQMVSKLEADLEESVVKVKDYQRQLEEVQGTLNDKESELADLTATLEQTQLSIMENEEKLLKAMSAPTDQVLEARLKKEKEEHEQLRKQYESLLSETNTTKGRLLSETNRDMDQQRRLVASEKTRQETLEFFQQQNKENQELIAKLETQFQQLNMKFQKAQTDGELAQHKARLAQDEMEKLRGEMRDMENLHQVHHQHSAGGGHRKQEQDPAKLCQKIRQLEFNLDLTKQKFEKIERRKKEFEEISRRAENLDFENGRMVREKRELQHSLDQEAEKCKILQQRYDSLSSSSGEVVSKFHNVELNLEKVTKENAKLRCELEVALGDLESAQFKGKEASASSQANHQNALEKVQRLERSLAEAEERLTLAEREKVKELNQMSERIEGLEQELRSAEEKHKNLEMNKENLEQILQKVKDQSSEKSSEHGALISRLEELQAERDQLTEQIKNLNNVRDNLEQALEKSRSQSSTVEADHEAALGTILGLEGEKGALEEELEAVKVKLADFQDEVQLAQGDARRMENQKKDFEREVEEQQLLVKEIAGELNEEQQRHLVTKEDLQRRHSERDALLAQIKALEERQNKIQEDAVQSDGIESQKLQDLEEKLTVQQSLVREIAAELDAEQRKHATTKDKMEQAQREKEAQSSELLQQAQQEKDTIATQLKQAEEVKVAIVSQLEQSQQEADSIASKLLQAEESKAEIISRLEESQQEKDSIATKLQQEEESKAAIISQLEESQRERDSIAKQLQQTDGSKAAILSQMEQSKATIMSQLAESQQERDSISTKLQHTEESKAEIMSQLAESQRERDSIVKQLQQTEESKAAIMSELEESQQGREAMSTELQKVHQTKDKVVSELELLQEEKASISVAMQGLRKELEDKVKEEARRINIQKEEFERMMEEQRMELKELASELTEEIQRHQNTTETFEERVKDAEQSIQDLEQQLASKNNDLESKCSRISELEASLAELENQVITLTANQRIKQEVKTEGGDLERRLSEMTKEKDRWYQELVDSEHELMDLTSAHERLQEKLTKKEKELTASSSLVSKLEGELSEALKQNEQSAANHTTVNKTEGGDLEEKLSEMTKEKDRWYQELVESEGELMDLTSAHERLQEKLQKKQEELTASSSLVSKLEGELSEALKQNNLSAANHATVNKVESGDLEKKLIKSDNELMGLKSAHEKLEETLAKKEKAYAALEKRFADMEALGQKWRAMEQELFAARDKIQSLRMEVAKRDDKLKSLLTDMKHGDELVKRYKTEMRRVHNVYAQDNSIVQDKAAAGGGEGASRAPPLGIVGSCHVMTIEAENKKLTKERNQFKQMAANQYKDINELKEMLRNEKVENDDLKKRVILLMEELERQKGKAPGSLVAPSAGPTTALTDSNSSAAQAPSAVPSQGPIRDWLAWEKENDPVEKAKNYDECLTQVQ